MRRQTFQRVRVNSEQQHDAFANQCSSHQPSKQPGFPKVQAKNQSRPYLSCLLYYIWSTCIMKYNICSNPQTESSSGIPNNFDENSHTYSIVSDIISHQAHRPDILQLLKIECNRQYFDVKFFIYANINNV
ncbi:Hypothetical_protein [Hexamita inflata]|uniref:Hypothetical_protein n=1 Tax=Hexamita inflata TaxID=28002 RepID=A0ABP1GY62_9EUKA